MREIFGFHCQQVGWFNREEDAEKSAGVDELYIPMRSVGQDGFGLFKAIDLVKT